MNKQEKWLTLGRKRSNLLFFMLIRDDLTGTEYDQAKPKVVEFL